MSETLKKLWLVLTVLGWAFVICTPLLAVWLASSIAAYFNGPLWLVCLSGLFLFPGLPLAWELRATRKQIAKRRQSGDSGPPWLARSTRLIVRTLVVNLSFLAVLLLILPQSAFTALATRGDWIADAVFEPETADLVRPFLLDGASTLEWLYLASSDNPYACKVPRRAPRPNEYGRLKQTEPRPPEPAEPVPPEVKPTPAPEEPDTNPIVPTTSTPPPPTPIGPTSQIEIVDLGGSMEPVPPDEPATPDEPPIPVRGGTPAWPFPNVRHRLAEVPAAVESDYASVARYIAANEPDAFLRVKAMHDYLTARLAYDYPNYRAGTIPRQDPAEVFDRKLAVCSGYAGLLAAMGEVTGDEIVVISGMSRQWTTDSVSGAGHAWNAAKIEGKWYLVDVTWDDAEGAYFTDYLFAPPEAFSATHLPDEPGWQLLRDPVSRSEFARAPLLKPGFYAHQLELISPTRSQVKAHHGLAEIRIRNRHTRTISAMISRKGSESWTQCGIEGRTDVTVTCEAPRGQYLLTIYAGDRSVGRTDFAAAFHVNSR